MLNQGETKPHGHLGLVVLGPDGKPVIHRRGFRTHIGRRAKPKRPSIISLLNESLPHFYELDEVRRFKAVNFMQMIRKRSFRPIIYSSLFKLASFQGSLRLRKITSDGEVFDFGLVGLKQVTDVGVDYIVDAFQNIVELEIMNFHGIGLGSTAEAQTETDLVTELTTQYSTDNTRATGTTVEGASSNIYRTVGTNTVDAAVALREHGVLNNATVGSGVLLDRTLYALINLASGDSLQSTYELTCTAGG